MNTIGKRHTFGLLVVGQGRKWYNHDMFTYDKEIDMLKDPEAAEAVL